MTVTVVSQKLMLWDIQLFLFPTKWWVSKDRERQNKVAPIDNRYFLSPKYVLVYPIKNKQTNKNLPTNQPKTIQKQKLNQRGGREERKCRCDLIPWPFHHLKSLRMNCICLEILRLAFHVGCKTMWYLKSANTIFLYQRSWTGVRSNFKELVNTA